METEQPASNQDVPAYTAGIVFGAIALLIALEVIFRGAE